MPPSGPGKTAPRLIEDLHHYDPHLEAQFGRNVLTDPPPHFEPFGKPVRAFPKGSCRHFFAIKYSQSHLPVPGESWESSTIYKVAAICTHCRTHLDILIDYHRAIGRQVNACPSEECPLHHFVHIRSDIPPPDNVYSSPPSVPHRFECSVVFCPVTLWVYLRPPRLNDQEIDLLTDPERLQQRVDAAIQEEPHRPDLKVARSVDGLSYLNIYIRDSLKPSSGKNRIPIRNRKFTTTFGRDCDQIFQKLGFILEESQDSEVDICWLMPRPSMEDDPLGGDSLRKLLEDVREELFALINLLPLTERNNAREMVYQPIPAVKDIEALLGSLDYDKVPSAHTIDLTKPEHPYYAGIGALSTFSDRLLWYSYERQASSDRTNAAYYFECIEDLAKGRRSETLDTQIALLASQGHISRNDIRKAYAYFGIQSYQKDQLTDDYIIGQFQSRLIDTSPKMEAEMREMLRRIGDDRKSDIIVQHASNAVETYPQALSYLNADESTPDDWIMTMYTSKVDESEANKTVADRALETIANQRNSDSLRVFMRTGQASMDVAEAYRILDIQDRSQKPDRGVLETYLAERLREQPHREVELQQAYALICKQEYGSNDNPVGSDDAQKYPLEKWPVGLQNIGNTCYLNSLLQFLFTIVPFRQLVLDCDEHMMALTPESIGQKRVGSEDITEERIIRAQLFVRELRKLFTHLITTPTRTIVPEVQLAVLAIEKPKSDNESREQVASEHLQSLGEIGGRVVMGPLLPPSREPINLPKPSADSDSDVTLAESEGTLEGDAAPTNTNEAAVNDKEGSASAYVEVDKTVQQSSLLLQPSGRSSHEAKNLSNSKLDEPPPPPPSRPPPVPPRPDTVANVPNDSGKVEFSGLQQDLNEIMENILYQVEYAIKPLEVLGGEQYDQIKELFFGETTTTLLKANGPTISSDIWNAINVSLGSGGCHIHTALDNEFDSDFNELDGERIQRFDVIKRAPPVLRINVRRVTFGLDGARGRKVDHPLFLDDIIFLDRYLHATGTHSEDELMNRRKKAWRYKKQLKELQKTRDNLTKTDIGTVTDVIDSTSVVAENQQDGSEAAPLALPQRLRLEAQVIREQVEKIDLKIAQLESYVQDMFADLKSEPYRLHAVFIHKGGAGGGHYYVYIHDEENSIWRKYNETVVSEATIGDEELFPQPNVTAQGYSTGVIYIRANKSNLSTQGLTQTLFRFPELPVDGQAESFEDVRDVEMIDRIDERRPLQVINGIEPIQL